GARGVRPLAVGDAAEQHLGRERRQDRGAGSLPPLQDPERQVRRQQDARDEERRQEAVVEPQPLLPFRQRTRGRHTRQLRHAGSFTRCSWSMAGRSISWRRPEGHTIVTRSTAVALPRPTWIRRWFCELKPLAASTSWRCV